MCGRFALYSPASKIAEVFEVLEPIEVKPRWNVAPTDAVLTIVQRQSDGQRRMGMMRWGLQPWFMRDQKGPPMINARSETIGSKPAFRQAFQQKRCIVPADGFFEWKKEGKSRIPYFFQRKDGRPLALAGLWDSWKDDDDVRHPSCTVLTTGPNALVEPLHDRMPVILHEADWGDWLMPRGEDLAEWKERLVAFPAEEMTVTRVSPRVNSVKNDDESCIVPTE